jgi:hypothetical protein
VARAHVLAVAVVLALVGPHAAQACVCVQQSLESRLDQADAAVVARLIGMRETQSQPPRRVLTFAVDQRVKGDVQDPFDVRSPSGTDCDLTAEENVPVGLLLTRGVSGDWEGSACSTASPGDLVAEGGEPRGGAIKVVIGLVILAIVLSWALRRRARGTRPHLPGAPEP